MSGYFTVAAPAEAEVIEKRSRFIAAVKPVQTEAEALQFLSERRQAHWDATHNVYAYILRENNLMRYSDDGEPSGTAGLPVLDMLKKEGLTDLIVVVTRYFGGTLLGTGGLVHTYSRSAKAGVEAAGRLEMRLCREVNLTCAYQWLGKVQNELSKWDLQQGETAFAEEVTLPVYLPAEDADRFCSAIIEKTSSRVEISLGEEEYRAKPV